MRWCLAICALVAACRGSRAPSRALDAIPEEAGVVVELTPRAVGGTWAEAQARAVARRGEVPACVLARAAAADRVVIAWAHMLPEDGYLLAIDGGPRGGCPALVERGALALWSHGLAPRADGEPGFFTDRDRRARFARLPKAPARAIADYELSAGVVARADVTLDPRAGVDARASVRFDAGSAADGVRARIERWRANADRDRLGGAWAAVAALTVAGPTPGDPTLALGLRLPDGQAATLLATAMIAGTFLDERMPCPAATAMTAWGVSCASGEVRVPAAVRDRILALPALGAAIELRAIGDAPALALHDVAPTSPLRALGFASDDVLLIDLARGPAGPLAAIVAAAAALPVDATAQVRVRRAGRRLTFRYRLVP
ncbi:MAG: hypothetical protein IPH44_02205 [Myxococcales bacterium]|nr:hypothetical protein [Myxococcales bacterium]MBK7198131.1 hypothetical protein [Myxococcales bacterium]MBP6844595.1 hypothetical protein [Kofleriaceae bacterium]